MNIEALNKQKCKIGNVNFVINKLNAFEGDEVFGLMRTELVKVANVLDGDDMDMATLLKAVMALPQATIREVRERLFNACTYQHEGINMAAPLDTHMFDTAFDGLDTFDIYELLARCLVVNFFSSSRKIKKLMAHLNPPTKLESPS
jgi:hypothetical protein